MTGAAEDLSCNISSAILSIAIVLEIMARS